VQLALDIGDTVKRIDGTEVPLLAPWGKANGGGDSPAAEAPAQRAKVSTERPSTKTAPTKGRDADSAKTAGPAKDKAETALANAPAQDEVAEVAPERLDAPREGGADDLKKIKGVGPQLAGLLNEMGFWHLSQIAAWGPGEIAWVDSRLKFKGRIVRDNWVAQAAELAKDA